MLVVRKTVSILKRLAVLFLLTIVAATKSYSQADTLFKYPTDQRVVLLLAVTSNQFLIQKDSSLVHPYFDRVEELSIANGDDRLKWYGRFYRRIYSVYMNMDRMGAFEKLGPWVDDCPLEVIKGAYAHFYGASFFDFKQFTKAFEWELKADKIFNEVGYEKIPELFSYLQGMAYLYYFFGDYPRTIQLLEEAARSPYHQPLGLIHNFNTQGMAYQKNGDYGKAKQQFQKVIDLAKSIPDSVWLGIASGNFGYTLSLQGHHSEAIRYLLEDYRINKIYEPYNTAISCAYLAQSYLKTGDIESAGKFLKEGRRLEADRNDPIFYSHFYRAAADYHSAVGNYRDGALYFDSTVRLRDSIRQVYNGQLLANAERRIEAEKFQSKLDRAATERRAAILRRNLVIAAFIAGLAFLLLVFQQRRRAYKKEQELLLRKQAIALEEKEIVQGRLRNAEERLSDYIASLTEKSDLIEKIRGELDDLQQRPADAPTDEKVQQLTQLMHFSILTENDWIRFKELFEKVHPHFLADLRDKYPHLTPGETRLLSLIKLNLSPREMSGMLGVSTDSVGKLKYRLRKKLAADEQDLEVLVSRIG